MRETATQGKLMIMVMLAVFVALCIGVAWLARNGHTSQHVRSPDPFPSVSPE